MQFVNSRPDIVQSGSQRWLLSYWDRLRGSAVLPQWPDMHEVEFGDMAASLSYQDVVDDGGGPRFLIRYHGRRISEAYGAICLGRFLDEILPLPYREAALATYRQVLATRLPVYTVADTRDRDGRTVHYERLLLPFGRDETRVDRILASLETVSPQGAFDNRELLKSPPKAPTFALCATIRH
jgi:hypothetical protein